MFVPVSALVAVMVYEAADSQRSAVLYTVPLAVNLKPSQSTIFLLSLCLFPPHCSFSFSQFPTELLHSLHTVYVGGMAQ